MGQSWYERYNTFQTVEYGLNLQYSQKETPRLNLVFNQFGQFWPNLHVNWMQLNLQIGYN